ncbi:MAG: FGGY-family carbohydrate kinase, partial [Actinomycetota bacterium]|nr:FGGY-family carbohydrate kinase [Actinomycetota bacterium]
SAEPSKYLLFAEMESAGACFKWLADELGPIMSEGIPKDDIYSYLDEIALKSPPGSNGLIFCPWMYGERSPIPDTTVRGGFINLSLDNKLEDIVRSVLEGVALHTRWIVDTLGRCGFRPNSLRIIGGGAKSDLWVQILADVLGRDIERVAEPQESGARGAALIAFVGLGVYKDISSLRKVVEVTRVFHPHKEHREIYDGAYVTIKEVYGRLRKLYSRINKG